MTLPDGENVMLPATAPQALAGVTADPSRGQVAFQVAAASGANGIDATVTMTGTDGASQTPTYLAADGSAVAGATSGAQGRFVNVPPGTYVLRFSQPSATCAPLSLYGWPMTMYQTAGVAAVVVPVMAGYVTMPVAASCAVGKWLLRSAIGAH
jgi:hypothetical protein